MLIKTKGYLLFSFIASSRIESDCLGKKLRKIRIKEIMSKLGTRSDLGNN